MMSFLRRARLILPILFLILGTGAGICFFLAFRGEYDPEIGHFLSDARFPTVALILIAAGILIAVLAAWIFRFTKHSLTMQYSAPLASFLSALVGFLLFASFIIDIRRLMDAGATILSRLLPALSALAAIHFISQAIRKEETPRTAVNGVLSLLPMVYAFARVLECYFDTSYAMNAPVKTMEMMTYLIMALFFTTESRLVLLRERVPQTTLFAGICGVLATASGLTEVLIVLSRASAPKFALMNGAVMLAVGLLALIRLYGTQEKEDTPDVQASENA